MKKGIVLFIFYFSCNCFSWNVLDAKWFKKELAKDLRSVLIRQGIDLEDGAEDLIFEYKIYKKLIQDSLLDDLIKNAGLELNEENRMIFFSAISKDLRDHIKQSFSEFTGNNNQPFTKNHPNGSNFNGVDPYFYYQTEMTRNLPAIIAAMGSKVGESKAINKIYLALGAAFIYFVTKFGILGRGIKIGYKYMQAKENVDSFVSKTSEVTSNIWSKLSKFGRSVIRPFTLVDYADDYEESQEFFKFYKLFEEILRDDRDFVQNHAKNYTEIIVHYRDGRRKKRKRYPRNESLGLG